MSGWPLETISSSGKRVFIDINYVLKHYNISDRKVAIEKLGENGFLKKVDGKPNIKAIAKGDESRILIEVIKPIVTKRKSPPVKDSKQPGAKGESNRDHKSPPGESKQPGAKGESNSDHKSPPGESKQPVAKGKSNSDHKSPPVKDSKQPGVKFNEGSNDSDINGVDYGLQMRVGKSTKGTLAHWIKEYYESPLPNKPPSKFVTEVGGETIIQAAWLVEFINKKSSSKGKVFLRHVLNELQSSGFKVSLNPESNCFHIDSTKINEMYLEIS